MVIFLLVVTLIVTLIAAYVTATWLDPRGPIKAAWNYFYGRIWGRVLMASLAYVVVFGLIFCWAGSKVDFFNDKTLPIKTWEDRRSFGLGVSGFLLSWLAIVGAILSAVRTKTMEEANRQQAVDHQQRLYMDALETLNRKQAYQKAGAIEALRRLGIQEDGEYRTHAIEILATFIRSTARIANQNVQSSHLKGRKHISPKSEIEEADEGRRIDPSGTALNLATALHALSDLQMQRKTSHSFFEEDFLTFENLDFSHLTFTKGKTLSRIHFRKCSFFKCYFLSLKFKDTNFWACNFDESILSHAHFMPGDGGYNINLKGSSFKDAYVHGTNFEHVHHIDTDQLRFARYYNSSPPKNVPIIRIGEDANGEGILPPPFIPDEVDKEIGSYLSIEETREFYSLNYGKERHPFRPRHQDQTPVPIAHPDDPTNVILD